MKPFDLDRVKAGDKVIRRDGLPVRVICTNIRHDRYPIIIAVTQADGKEYILISTNDGKAYFEATTDSDGDLFMAPTIKSGWVNVYSGEVGQLQTGIITYETEEDAIRNKIVCEEWDYVSPHLIEVEV